MSHHVFGVRHHGPGSARSLLRAFEQLEPDAVLVEGPPEADPLIPLVAVPEMRPPVALLVYRPEQPQQAVYYPFGIFSPEWQALLWGARRGLRVRFMDLPQAHRMALPPTGPDDTADDPLLALARAAGHVDIESWWDRFVEDRRSTEGLFPAVLEAMRALREKEPQSARPLDIQREAFMRKTIRAALRDGCERVAVVCGAWHAPALVKLPPARPDELALRGLPRVRTQAAWIPWTHGRMLQHSGYGAGIESPGWCRHLWTSPEPLAVHWMVAVARLLREQDLDASPAQLIEAVRLAESLAAMRERPAPGLGELQEAVQAVLCFGNPVPMRLVHEKLIVGEELGAVPAASPPLPLQQDLRREQKRLRLEPQASAAVLELDLRKTLHRERSCLLHRLRLLGLDWGLPLEPARPASGRSGTFHERWNLRWRPELSGVLVEAGIWGTTVEQAATARAIDGATRAASLPELSLALEHALLAELPSAVRTLGAALEQRAALASDAGHLLCAVPPLCGVVRYGSVRQSDSTSLRSLLGGLVLRACLALPGACRGLDDAAAQERMEQMLGAHGALEVLASAELLEHWQGALRRLADSCLEAGSSGQDAQVHRLLQGRACWLLFEAGAFDEEGLERRMGLALSRSSLPAHSAAWIAGLLGGSALVLLHDERLWQILDGWLTKLRPEAFLELLPLLRRTFAGFAPAERRRMGEKIQRSAGLVDEGPGSRKDFDGSRADLVLGVIARLLGVKLQ